jgi:hypothetical protein
MAAAISSAWAALTAAPPSCHLLSALKVSSESNFRINGSLKVPTRTDDWGSTLAHATGAIDWIMLLLVLIVLIYFLI